MIINNNNNNNNNVNNRSTDCDSEFTQKEDETEALKK
jgi:hypothetical protein